MKKKPEEEYAEKEGNEQTPNQGPSFEELLREIRKDQTETVPEENRDEWTKEVSDHDYSEDIRDEQATEEEVFIPGEKTHTSAYRSIKQPLVKLDDQVDLEDNKKILGEVVDVAGEYTVGNKYAKILKNPETLKDAVILTEVFNRKHF
ncbi:hypothetical protein Q4534_07475 [Cyclobacterium sp. 1_MG-2023]|uniref:hypothetical protein n=1 Tax=Cyclobacterium sp. 1_MG-2023 TaxID=3062681 RepID=UPI0026E48274|nr:hypothetical protein [Cyclobacterium sp. 1_MG-2023]MDO6437238.1 hypothetical protein [Cyclobacterium sp. 1_MG-2023]